MQSREGVEQRSMSHVKVRACFVIVTQGMLALRVLPMQHHVSERRQRQPSGAKPKPPSFFSPPISSSCLPRFFAGMQLKDDADLFRLCFSRYCFSVKLLSPGQVWFVQLPTPEGCRLLSCSGILPDGLIVARTSEPAAILGRVASDLGGSL